MLQLILHYILDTFTQLQELSAFKLILEYARMSNSLTEFFFSDELWWIISSVERQNYLDQSNVLY